MCHFLPFYPSNSPKNQNFKQKKAWRYHLFIYVYQKLWSDDVWFLKYGARQMDRRVDRQTDGWKKWHKEVGAPPKKWDENQSIFNFLLCMTGTSQHFLRSNYLEMWYIVAQEVPFLEFHIPSFWKVLWQTHLFTFSN